MNSIVKAATEYINSKCKVSRMEYNVGRLINLGIAKDKVTAYRDITRFIELEDKIAKLNYQLNEAEDEISKLSDSLHATPFTKRHKE